MSKFLDLNIVYHQRPLFIDFIRLLELKYARQDIESRMKSKCSTIADYQLEMYNSLKLDE